MAATRYGARSAARRARRRDAETLEQHKSSHLQKPTSRLKRFKLTISGRPPMETTILWFLCVALIVLGLAGTVLPLLPGTLLVWGGIVLGAWIDDFSRVGTTTVWVITALALLAWALDYVAGLMGASKVGASQQALLGAAVGTVAGLLMGLVGVLFMPLVGAAVGEYLARRDQRRAVQVGVATWIGIMVGLVAKVVLAFVMVGIFVAALLI